jgi:ABC-type sugar transport system ATPase subunit
VLSSGRQQQRVTIGCAIVRNPRAFLKDEPLSNLDAPLWAAMRAEVRRPHTSTASPRSYVTRDQVKAMRFGLRVRAMTL